MLNLFKRQDDKDLEAVRDITDDVDEADFIPYACHYSPHTILTKNGELMQIIKISGFAHDESTGETQDLRDTVRRAILQHVRSDDYAFWVHTVRSRKDLSLPADFPDGFSQQVDAAWNRKNDWGRKFTNEVYLTIVKEGQSASILAPKEFLRGLWAPAERRYRSTFLQKASAELDAVVDAMLTELRPVGGQRLGLAKRDEVLYSEPCEFLGKLINLVDDPMPLPDIDLAQYLTTQEITFGFNAMEVRSHAGKRRFGAVLTLKDYKELPSEYLDRFLQLPIEFIVSQCLDFINRKEALEDYTYQNSLLALSKDQRLAEVSGLTDIVQSEKGRPVDFGSQQISVFLLADDLRQLERYVQRATTTLFSLGVLTVREDIRFEECYWAQLPGNFEFLQRLKSINTRRFAGFANLSNFASGTAKGNQWGDAITLVGTAGHTPYYFNFHSGSNGHTLVVGTDTASRQRIVNFLIAQAQRFRPRVVLFDRDHISEIFVRAMGGTYRTFSASEGMRDSSGAALPLNPFQMEDNEKNRRFLGFWLLLLVVYEGASLGESEAGYIRSALDQLFRLPITERTLRRFVSLLGESHPELAQGFSPWLADGPYAALFDHGEDSLTLGAGITGFDLGALAAEPALAPVATYLLHRLAGVLDGTPTLVVMEEGWQLLENPLYAPRVSSWMGMLSERNTAVVMGISDLEGMAHSTAGTGFVQGTATQLYGPEDAPSPLLGQFLRLPDKDIAFLPVMDESLGHVMVRRGDTSTIVEFDFSGMEDILPVLTSTPEGRQRMATTIAQRGAEPAQWLTAFLQER